VGDIEKNGATWVAQLSPGATWVAQLSPGATWVAQLSPGATWVAQLSPQFLANASGGFRLPFYSLHFSSGFVPKSFTPHPSPGGRDRGVE